MESSAAFHQTAKMFASGQWFLELRRSCRYSACNGEASEPSQKATFRGQSCQECQALLVDVREVRDCRSVGDFHKNLFAYRLGALQLVCTDAAAIRCHGTPEGNGNVLGLHQIEQLARR